jgi:ATP-dependent exoDNAse (exonuclease V) beta subunit
MATIAVEVPVYLYPGELTTQDQKKIGVSLQEPLTGHIDILQIRWDNIHILDYKPDARMTDKPAAEQLYLYALALSKRTKIPLTQISCAYFDDTNYYEFAPLV